MTMHIGLHPKEDIDGMYKEKEEKEEEESPALKIA